MESCETVTIKVEKDIEDWENCDEFEEFSVIVQNDDQEDQKPTLSNGNQAQTKTDNNASTQGPKLSTNVTKSMAKFFVQNGCSSTSYQDAVNKYNKERVDAYLETVNRVLKEAPENVYQECESLCFSNISEWLEVFKERKVQENCFFEQAIVMNAIANNEKHKRPGGVDLKAVYTFLSNALLGAPQKPLNAVTAKFLCTEFQKLIDEANSDYADSQTLTMKEKLEKLLPPTEGVPPPSLDPLFLMDDTVPDAYTLSYLNNTKEEPHETYI